MVKSFHLYLGKGRSLTLAGFFMAILAALVTFAFGISSEKILPADFFNSFLAVLILPVPGLLVSWIGAVILRFFGIPCLQYSSLEASPPTNAPLSVETPNTDPCAHHDILAYLRRLWAGEPPDEAMEAKSLRDIGFNTLNMAELLLTVIHEHKLPEDSVLEFMRIPAPESEKKLATLLERILILSESKVGESMRIQMLASGVVGNRSEITSIREEHDNVGFVVKYCKAIEAYCIQKK